MAFGFKDKHVLRSILNNGDTKLLTNKRNKAYICWKCRPSQKTK